MNPVAQMLLNEPAPAAIWAALMLLCLPAVLLLGSPQSLRHPRLAVLDIVGAARRRSEQRLRRQLEAVEVIRYADEIKVAADQAVAAAERWRESRDRAAAQADTAWLAWQDADTELTRLRAAAAYANPWTAPTPAEYAARERYLHRVVRSAVTRGDLPATALDFDGWDATRHQFDQDVALARAIVAHRRELYRQAAAAEVAAAHDAQLAIRSRDSLRREYVVAAVHAADVHHRLPANLPPQRSGRTPAIARVA
jgi:hypothetical protein